MWPHACLLLCAVVVSWAGAAQAAADRPVPAETRPCAGGEVIVTGASAADFAEVCQGAAAALAFFAGHDVRPTEPIAIEVVVKIPAEAGPTAAGCYIEDRRKVYLLPWAAFRRNRTWFHVPIDKALYRALATHEAAHAIAACNFSIPRPTIQAKEYLAYAAMFATLPPALRDKALKATRPVGFDSLDRFTPMLYMFDPMRFGAEAHLHFSRVPDRRALLRDVLDGRALTD